MNRNHLDVWDVTEFALTADHLKLMSQFSIGWDYTEYGAPVVDEKRPYGNSDVAKDIARILGWPLPADDDDAAADEARRRAWAVHRELAVALQLLCSFAGHPLRPGVYRKADRRRWEFVAPAGAE